MLSRIFFKLQPALERDLKDWLVETRIKTSELLCVLLIHLEQDVVGHAEKVLNLLCLGIRDADQRVRQNVGFEKLINVGKLV